MALLGLLGASELGLLRGRLLLATSALLGLAFALGARTVSDDPFHAVAAGALPPVVALMLQAMTETAELLAAARRRDRRRTRRST